MTLTSNIVVIFFIGWAFISIVCQFKKEKFDVLRAYDFCGLIPTWTFFAPNPVSSDRFLYYRDYVSDKSTEWKKANKEESFACIDLLWNPSRREEKAITDAMFQLLRMSDSFDKDRLHLTTSYLTILNFITTRTHEPNTVAIQFLFATKRFDEFTKPLFVSSIHAIP